jgi:MerC mercury resistance protein
MNQNSPRRTLSMHADRLGMFASALCFVHCVLAPVIVSLLAVGAHYLPSEEKVHRTLAVSVAAFGSLAIFFGYRRHRRSRVIFLLGCGLLLIFAAAYVGDRLPSRLAEVAVTMTGSCFMIAGHFLNHTFCRNCERCQDLCSSSAPAARSGRGEQDAL